jgi:hypothetical protein
LLSLVCAKSAQAIENKEIELHKSAEERKRVRKWLEEKQSEKRAAREIVRIEIRYTCHDSAA